MQLIYCLRNSTGRLRRGGGGMACLGWCSPGVCLFRAPIWCPSRGGGTRHTRGTIAWTLVALYRLGRHQIRRRRRAARSSTSQGSAKPLCARIKRIHPEVYEEKADVWLWSVLYLRGPTRSMSGQDSKGVFTDARGFGRLDAGSRADSIPSRPPPPWI